MDIRTTMQVMNLIETCPVCGDNNLGNGSRLVIEETTFERTCRECGWQIVGKVENGEVIITGDNRSDLCKKIAIGNPR